MFVASYARLPPGSRFHLSVNVQIFPCNARYRALRLQSGLGRTVYYSARYHLGATSLQLGPFITMRGTASVPLGPSVTMRGTASVPLGPSITMRGTASVPLGPFITMCGAASVPLGPSITMRGTASVLLGPSITMRGTASVPLRYRSGPLLQCAVPTPRLRFTKFELDRSEVTESHETQP